MMELDTICWLSINVMKASHSSDHQLECVSLMESGLERSQFVKVYEMNAVASMSDQLYVCSSSAVG